MLTLTCKYFRYRPTERATRARCSCGARQAHGVRARRPERRESLGRLRSTRLQLVLQRKLASLGLSELLLQRVALLFELLDLG